MKKLLFIAVFAIAAVAAQAQCVTVKDSLVTDSTKYKIQLCPEYLAQYTAGINRYVVHMDLWMKVDNTWVDVPFGSYAAFIDETDAARATENQNALFTAPAINVLKENLLELLNTAK